MLQVELKKKHVQIVHDMGATWEGRREGRREQGRRKEREGEEGERPVQTTRTHLEIPGKCCCCC